eukprot:1026984-Rhodomonas_salina.1
MPCDWKGCITRCRYSVRPAQMHTITARTQRQHTRALPDVLQQESENEEKRWLTWVEDGRGVCA